MKQSKRLLPRYFEASVLDISCGFIFPLTLVECLPQILSKPNSVLILNKHKKMNEDTLYLTIGLS